MHVHGPTWGTMVIEIINASYVSVLRMAYYVHYITEELINLSY